MEVENITDRNLKDLEEILGDTKSLKRNNKKECQLRNQWWRVSDMPVSSNLVNCSGATGRLK